MSVDKHVDAELTRHLDEIVKQPKAVHAVLFTADGIPKASSSSLTEDGTDRAAAGLTGIGSLSRSLVDLCGTTALTWNRTIIDFESHTVIVFTAAVNTYLAVSVAAGMGSLQTAAVTRTATDVARALRRHLGAEERAA